MNEKVDLLKSNHIAQIHWLRNQIAMQNTSIFLNPTRSIEIWEGLLNKSMGQIDAQELETFIVRYLSDSGFKKLYITLRVAKTRSNKKSSGYSVTLITLVIINLKNLRHKQV